MTRICFLFSVLCCITSSLVNAQQSFVVNANKPVAEVQPTMWGIFFEDINFGADGGLYAELIKNRSFEFSKPLMGWEQRKKNNQAGNVLIINRGETSVANPRFARVTVNNANENFGLTNEGFKGMGIKKDMQYNFSLWASQYEGVTNMRIELVDKNGKTIGTTNVKPEGKEWKKYAVSFNATTTEQNAKLTVWFEGKGITDVDMISLFPNDTWKQRPNGLRADLVQLLYDMKPGFLRFPGGCIVEGKELATRYQWKKTVGEVEERQVEINRWNTEFSHRPAPDYFQSFGLGFFEYFQLAEDLGAEPLPILNCGMACQFNTAEVVPLNQIDPYVQDALDLIEFANGDAKTTWGKLRIAMGHATPFNLKLLGVGNEQWGSQYIDRYKIFAKAIKEKYPDIKLVTSVGPSPEGEQFDYLNPTLRELHADIIDEHYYQKPDWFLQHANRYDNYDRKGPKIFAGEYAAQSVATVSPDNKNTWQCALSEAAFMTGLERNADVVYMASYAPLFAHVEGWQWTPDLIWFDNLRAYGTPNYYVQKLFSTHKGTSVLSISDHNKPVTGQNGLYASAVKDDKAHTIMVKIVNSNSTSQNITLTFDGINKLASNAVMTVLKSNDANDVNTLDDPLHVSPTKENVNVKGKRLNCSLAPSSFTVLTISIQ